MPSPPPIAPARRQSREAVIEEAIMASPEKLGFPGALPIRRCRVAERCGTVDLMLLPRSGPVRLVLVEAKATRAPDAASKVVGQLLMYYAGALMLGARGLQMLESLAVRHADYARSLNRVTPKRLTGGLSPPTRAWQELYTGTKLRPDELRLFVAFDGQPHEAFAATLATLWEHHRVPLGYCVVAHGAVASVMTPAGNHPYGTIRS
jgi:hypothetical protein